MLSFNKFWNMKLKIIFICLFFNYSTSKELEIVNEDDLISMLQSDEFNIVLFTKKNCTECENLETSLINLAEEIREHIGTVPIKIYSSQMVRLYNPKREPSLIYFRNGNPLLYNGNPDENSILQVLLDNREPTVKELSDDNFEHLTQASSGATTGDWLVMFYSSDCVECNRLGAVWEGVGAALKNKVNTARVNRFITGVATAKRFNINSSPEFLLLRQGKFYRYEATKRDIKSFVSFALEWYRNSRPEKVPVPSSPFDGVVNKGALYLKKAIIFGKIMIDDYYYITQIAVYGTIFLILISFLRKYLKSRNKAKENKRKAK